MLAYPYPRAVEYAKSWTDARPATTTGTQVTAGGSAHTLGTKVVLFSSTAFDAWWVRVIIMASGTAATRTDALINIYVGADTAEQVIIPNLLAGATGTFSAQEPLKFYYFPLHIPAGSRITCDMQSVTASRTARVAMELWGGGFPLSWYGKKVEAVGATPASSIGVSVTPGTSSEGSFTNIGTTSQESYYILPGIGGQLADTNNTNGVNSLDIGVGGSVYRECDDFWFEQNNNENNGSLHGGLGRFVIVPSSTTLQARIQTSSGTAEAQDVIIYVVF